MWEDTSRCTIISGDCKCWEETRDRAELGGVGRLCGTAWLDGVRTQVTDIGAESDPGRGNNKGQDPDVKHLRDGTDRDEGQGTGTSGGS